MGHLHTSLLRPQSQLSASHTHLFSSGTPQSPQTKYKPPFLLPASFPLSSMRFVSHLLCTTLNTLNYVVCRCVLPSLV